MVDTASDVYRTTAERINNGAQKRVASALQHGTEASLYRIARDLTTLTFQETMQLCEEIVGRQGYEPPSTPYDFAALLNVWSADVRSRHESEPAAL